MTAFVGILDPQAGRLSYVSAGQGPLLVYRAAEKQAIQLNATSLPLAIVPDAEFPAGEPIDFAPGDMLVLVTDGFFEWSQSSTNKKLSDQFGIERVIDVIREHDHRPAREIIERLYDAVRTFSQGSPQDDDLTAIIIKKI